MDMLPDNTIDFRNPLEYFKQNKEDYERLREVLGSFHLKGDARLPRASEGIKYVRDILKLYERDMKALEVAALISEQFYFGDPSPKDNITLDFFYSDPTQNPAKFLDAIAAQLQNELEGQFGFVSSALNWHKMRNRLDDVCNGNYNQSENTAYDGCMILFSEALYTPGNTKTNETGAIINEARKCINEVARGNDFYRPLIIRAFDHCYMNRAAKLYKDYLTLTAGDVGKPK